MHAQRTLRRHLSCAGIGLHSGSKVTLSLKPAPADSGIRFRRSDLGGLEVPATVRHVGGINHATGLMRDAVRVDTVEHLLAAFISLGVDNVVVELNSPEVPIMDGSAAPFVFLLQSAGHTVTIQIADLTSEDRDGINRHLAQRNDLRLVFACVPAGILVFETTDRESGALQELLRHHIPRDRAQFVPMDRESAENSCAQARN